MEVYLPATSSSPQKLLDDFRTGGNWQTNIQPSFKSRQGLLLLPKFRMEFAVGLNDSLKALGMKHAFDKDATFSAMAEEPLFISEVKQKSYVDVDEQGTESAAVTTVTMMASSLPMRPPDRFEMIVDRPFLFVISDDATDSILFIGIVNDPVAGGTN